MDGASIADDSTHGASQLAARAAEVLLATLDSGGDLHATAVDLARAQPAMASLLSLADRVLRATDEAAVRVVLHDAISEDRLDSAAAFAADLIFPECLVLTHSNSSAVEKTFLAARRRGLSFRTIIPESRPLREGLVLASSLVERGIPARVIADAAVWRFMPEVDLVLVGADAVTPGGVINKIGTSLIALAARECQKPVYVVCTADRLVGVQMPADALRPAEEIVPERLAGLSVANYYFDTSPLEWFTMFVTETGSYSVDELRPKLSEIEIHPDLLAP